MPPLPEDVPLRDRGPVIRMRTQAWIVFGHGSSDPDWSGPIRAIAHRLSERLGEPRVALAFLERQPPTLEQAAAAVIGHGATHVTVAPMFLGVGGRSAPARIAPGRLGLPTPLLLLRDPHVPLQRR